MRVPVAVPDPLLPRGVRLAVLAVLALLVAAAYAGSAHQCLDHPGHTCQWGVFSQAYLPEPAAGPETAPLVLADWHTSPAEIPGERSASCFPKPSRAPPPQLCVD